MFGLFFRRGRTEVRPYQRGIAYGNCCIENRQINRQSISPINGNG